MLEVFTKEQRTDAQMERSQAHVLGLGTRRLPTWLFVVIGEQAIPCPGDVTSAKHTLQATFCAFKQIRFFREFLQTYLTYVHVKICTDSKQNNLMYLKSYNSPIWA